MYFYVTGQTQDIQCDPIIKSEHLTKDIQYTASNVLIDSCLTSEFNASNPYQGLGNEFKFDCYEITFGKLQYALYRGIQNTEFLVSTAWNNRPGICH